MWAVPCLCELYLGICLTTEEQAQKNFIRGSQSVPVGMMKTEYSTIKTELAILFNSCDNLHGSSGVAQPLQLKQNEYKS